MITNRPLKLNNKISVDRALFNIFYLYISLTVLLPKIDFGFVTIYLFEISIMPIGLYLLAKKKMIFLTNIEKYYLLFMYISTLTYVSGVFNTEIIDVKTIFLIIKYTSFGFIIPISYHFSKYINRSKMENILLFQLAYVLIFGTYVLYNMYFYPIPVGDIIWSYSKEYRLIGFTGYAFGVDGLRSVGNTSVQTGVFIALLFLLYFSLYINLNKKRYLLFMFITLVGELLTQSRTGLLITIIGTL